MDAEDDKPCEGGGLPRGDDVALPGDYRGSTPGDGRGGERVRSAGMQPHESQQGGEARLRLGQLNQIA